MLLFPNHLKIIWNMPDIILRVTVSISRKIDAIIASEYVKQ